MLTFAPFQGTGNPWKQDLEIRQILGAPLPTNYYQVPENESDAWKENEISFESLMKRLRESDAALLKNMRRSRRPMLFSVLNKNINSLTAAEVESQVLLLNAGTKAVTEAVGLDFKSSIGKKVSSLVKPTDESLNIDKIIMKCWRKNRDAHIFVHKGGVITFGLSIVVLYNVRDEAIGLVYV